jgi:hypothetical protein
MPSLSFSLSAPGSAILRHRLSARQLMQGVEVHYARSIDDALAVALPQFKTVPVILAAVPEQLKRPRPRSASRRTIGHAKRPANHPAFSVARSQKTNVILE